MPELPNELSEDDRGILDLRFFEAARRARHLEEGDNDCNNNFVSSFAVRLHRPNTTLSSCGYDSSSLTFGGADSVVVWNWGRTALAGKSKSHIEARTDARETATTGHYSWRRSSATATATFWRSGCTSL